MHLGGFDLSGRPSNPLSRFLRHTSLAERTTQKPSAISGQGGVYPNLSQYAANRAQTAQSEPTRVFSFSDLPASQGAITRLLNRCSGKASATLRR